MSAISKLLDALETCHVCQGILHLEDHEPTHCEDCSWDCEEHEEPACTPIYQLHAAARRELFSMQAEIERLRAEVAA